MSRYHDIAEVFAEYAAEIDEDAGELAPMTRRRRTLEGAAALILRAAELLLELDVGPELAAEVRALEALCQCGHDRGDHFVDAPHACDGVRLDVEPGQFDCDCKGFRPEPRDTLADFMTEPAPAPMGDAS